MALGLVALLAARPQPCSSERERCPDKDGNLPSIGIFEHEPCNERGVETWQDSCEFLRRHKKIASEEHRADGWAGIYKSADGYTSLEVALDRDGWAGLRESFDTGPRPGIEGRYRVEDGSVVLEIDTSRSAPWLSGRLIYAPVRWGPRLYLVQRDQFAEFVNDVNRGFYLDNEWDSPFALPRRRDAKAPLCGLPEVPKEWTVRLHSQPLLVSVIHVESDPSPPRDKWEADKPRYRIEVDAGLQAGLFPGMKLSTLPNDAACGGASIDVVLDDVDATRARGRLKVSGADEEIRIANGLKLTTGAKAWQLPSCVAAGRSDASPSSDRR